MSKHRVEWYKYRHGSVTEVTIVCKKDDGTFTGFRVKGNAMTQCPNCGATISAAIGITLMVDGVMEWPE